MVCNALTRQGKEGPIEHIHRGILFIHDRHHLENGGFLCVRARACLALGGSHRGMERPVSVYHVHDEYLSDVGREGGSYNFLIPAVTCSRGGQAVLCAVFPSDVAR